MQKIEDFLKTKPGKITAVILCLLIIVGIITAVAINLNQPSFQESSNKIDDPSGLDVYDSNAEDEGEDTSVVIIGFNVFYDFGFSETQQEKIYNTVKLYIEENAPSAATVSYEKGSFRYTNEDESSQSEFKIITDTKKEYLVSLDTKYSYNGLDITIKEL